MSNRNFPGQQNQTCTCKTTTLSLTKPFAPLGTEKVPDWTKPGQNAPFPPVNKTCKKQDKTIWKLWCMGLGCLPDWTNRCCGRGSRCDAPHNSSGCASPLSPSVMQLFLGMSDRTSHTPGSSSATPPSVGPSSPFSSPGSPNPTSPSPTSP
jgi:hypothetical protein